MAGTAKDIELLCPHGATLYMCPNARQPFIGCCTTDPCEDKSGTCPASHLIAATFDPNTPPYDVSHECLGGEWYTCPELETPFAGCCLQDACLARCPVEDLRAAVLADYYSLVFKMAGAETGDATSTESTYTRATSKSEATHIPSSPMSMTATTAEIPSGATSHPTPDTTVLVPDPHGKNDLSDSQEVGIGVTAGVIGFLIVGCIAHRIIVHIRKRRPGFPHRTDHDPGWRPPSSPIELNPSIAPGTRKCGLDRMPGEVTRPGSWDYKENNAAETKLTGLDGPRRVRSADPGFLLHKAPKACGKDLKRGQASQRSLPLPDIHDQHIRSSRSIGSSSTEQNRPLDWVTGNEHAKHHGHSFDNGDFSVKINSRGWGSCSTDAQVRPAHSVDKLRRHETPYCPATRSDDQLNRLVLYPHVAKLRPAPRSDGAAQALDLSQHLLRTYAAYTPPDKPTQHLAHDMVSNRWSNRDVFELEATPLGGIRDPRARTTLGNVEVLNPDTPRNSTVIDPDEIKDGAKKEGIQVKGDASAAEQSSSGNGTTTNEISNTDVKKDSGEKTFNEITTLDLSMPPVVITDTGATPSSVIDALCPMATLSGVPDETEKEPGNQASRNAVPSPFMASVVERVRPHLSLENPRPPSTASISSIMHQPQKVNGNDGLSDSRSAGTRHSSLEPDNPGVLTHSSTAPGFQRQEERPKQADSHPSNIPRTLAIARQQTSEPHMNIPANDNLQCPSHPSMDRRPEGNVVSPHGRQQQHPSGYVLTPKCDDGYTEQQNGQYCERYSNYPAAQRPIRPNYINAEQRDVQNPRTTPGHQQHNHDPVEQASSQPRQPYSQVHHTRVYYTHRANPRGPLTRPSHDTATTRPRRSAQDRGLGPQPQPGYRTFQGALDLNRGNDIARRDIALQPPQRPDAYSSAGSERYGGAGSSHERSAPRSEYSESWGDDRTYGRGSETSSWKDFPFGSQRYRE